MNTKDIHNLIKQGESSTIEFKTSTAQLKTAFETICAFLNSDGGTVLIGINDKGDILGQTVTDQTQQEIAREINKIKPYADISVHYVDIQAKQTLIVISVKRGVNAPYVYDDRPFLRNQSTTVRMPQEHYQYLLYERNAPSSIWEKLKTNQCALLDLDLNRIQQVVRIAVEEGRLAEFAMRADIDQLLKKLELLVDNKLANAAVILFCNNSDKQFIQSELRLARFKGITKSEFIDNKAIRGNAFDLYEQAMAFIRTYLPIAGKVEEGNSFRVNTPAIPHKVLREALVNALCHRDYSSPSGSLNLAIYDDRVEIISTGRLPSTIHVKDLSKPHASYPRNPVIANIFYACALIERWGRGTQEMVELCQQSGNPKPQFIESTGSFTVSLPLKEPIGPSIATKSTTLSRRQHEILALLQQASASSKEIQTKLLAAGTVLTTRTIQADLSSLEKLGLVRHEGQARAIVWKLI